MTESEWLASSDPAAMLQWLIDHHQHQVEPTAGIGRGLDRKLRLFACACCRQVWHLLTDERSRRAVELMEGWGDGISAMSREERESEEPEDGPRQVASAAAMRAQMDMRTNETAHAADAAWAVIGYREASFSAAQVLRNLSPLNAMPTDPAAQAALLRDTVGNPFRPVKLPLHKETFDPPHDDPTNPYGSTKIVARYRCRWITPQVLTLARAAYEERQGDGALDPFRLALLADALEDAGCGSDDLLWHLRGDAVNNPHRPSPHVRGCWAVDIVLGKE